MEAPVCEICQGERDFFVPLPESRPPIHLRNIPMVQPPVLVGVDGEGGEGAMPIVSKGKCRWYQQGHCR